MNYFNNNGPAHIIYKKTSDDKIHFLSFPFPSYFSSINDCVDTFSINTYLGSFKISDISDRINNGVSHPGPYPLAVRYMDENYSIIERPPFQIKVDYSPTRSGASRREIKPVTIWIPWTVCVINIKAPHYSRIYFNDSPIQSLEDTVILPWTSNVFQDGKICLGASSRFLSTDDENFDIYSWYHSFLNEYFFGGWNSDIHSYEHREFLNSSPNLFFSDYSSLKNITSHPLVDQSIVDKIKSSKIKFHSSALSSFTMTNIYYNLSLLNLEQTLSLVSSLKESSSVSTHKKTSISSLITQQNNDKFSFVYIENSLPSLYSDSVSITVNIKNNTYLSDAVYSPSASHFNSSKIYCYIEKFLEDFKTDFDMTNFTMFKQYMYDHYHDKFVKLIQENSEFILDSVIADIDNPLQTFNLEANLTATRQDLENFVNEYTATLNSESNSLHGNYI